MKFLSPIRCILFSLIISFTSNANALDNMRGKVVTLVPNAMPHFISFKMDAGTSGCLAGAWVIWTRPDIENNKAVYSTLSTALVGKKDILVHVQTNTCDVVYIDLLQ